MPRMFTACSTTRFAGRRDEPAAPRSVAHREIAALAGPAIVFVSLGTFEREGTSARRDRHTGPITSGNDRRDSPRPAIRRRLIAPDIVGIAVHPIAALPRVFVRDLRGGRREVVGLPIASTVRNEIERARVRGE